MTNIKTTEFDIFEMIREDRMPYWELKAHPDPYSRTGLARGKADLDAVPDEEKTEVALEQLQSKLMRIKNEGAAFYSITIRTSKTANQAGMQENIRFVLSNALRKDTENPGGGLNGLNSFEPSLNGYVSREHLSELLNLERQKSALEIEKKILQMTEENRKKALEAKELELKEMEREFNTDVNKIGKGVMMGIGKIVEMVISGQGVSLPGVIRGLQGIEEPEETRESSEPDPKHNMVESIAEKLYSNFSETELTYFNNLITNALKSKENGIPEKRQPEGEEHHTDNSHNGAEPGGESSY